MSKKAQRRAQRRRKRRYEILSRLCAEQQKPAYPTVGEALQAILTMRPDPPLVPYECVGHWHLTRNLGGSDS